MFLNGYDTYYLGLLVFFVFSIYFRFYNIENLTNIMIETTVMCFIAITLICFITQPLGSIYYFITNRFYPAPLFDNEKVAQNLA